MTKIKFIGLIICTVLTVQGINVFAADISRVGEHVVLHSGGIPDGEGDNSFQSTLTERERQAAQTNSTASQEITQKAGLFLRETNGENGYLIAGDGVYTFITEHYITPQKLRQIIQNADKYDPGGSGFNISQITPGAPQVRNADDTVFQRVVGNILGGSSGISGLELSSLTSPAAGISGITWEQWNGNGFGSSSKKVDLIKGGGQRIRSDIDGGFIDYPDMQKRYEMLDVYLNASASADTIKTQYIVEYRIEDTAHHAIYRMVGRNGINSYTWSFENTDTGETYNLYNMPPSIIHQFMRAGRYNIDVDKDVYKTFCDAFTFSVCEYWIVEETGQVIWKKETKGNNIDPSIPVNELGFKNMVVYNIPDESELPSMVTIDVAHFMHRVTEDMLNQSIPAEASFRTFYTERIK